MKVKHHIRIVLILPFLLSNLVLQAADKSYHAAGEISLGDSTSPGLLSVDGVAPRLYAFTRSNVFVVDLERNQVTGRTNLANVSCFLPFPKFSLGYYGTENQPNVRSVNLNTLKSSFEVNTPGRPQGLFMDSNGSLAFAFCYDGSGVLFEVDDGDFMGNFSMPGTVRSAVMEPQTRRVFCSMEKGNQVVAFKASSKAGAIMTWSVAPGENPSALVFDPMTKRLLVGCSNNLLLSMDATTGKVVDSVTIDSGTDTIVFDPASRQVFATAGKGAITIVRLLPQKMQVGATLSVPSGSRCLAVDPKTRKIYVGAAGESKILVFGP